MLNPALYTSKKNNWGTPRALFNKLNLEFNFVLDVCANVYNAKCSSFYDKECDGLASPWFPGPVWCNPPYGRETGLWCEKALHEAETYNVKSVVLVPARTDTRWFHTYCTAATEIRFIKGRLKFEDKDGDILGSAPFPSMLVIFDPFKGLHKFNSTSYERE